MIHTRVIQKSGQSRLSAGQNEFTGRGFVRGFVKGFVPVIVGVFDRIFAGAFAGAFAGIIGAALPIGTAVLFGAAVPIKAVAQNTQTLDVPRAAVVEGQTIQESAQEREYKKLALRFEERDGSLLKDLKPYLQKYPYTTYEDEIHFFGGVMQAEKGKWKQAAKELEQVDHKALTRPHQTEYQFYRGYTYLMLQEYARASTYFALLRKTDNDYTTKATYYYAYCQYKQQHYDKALPALLSLEGKSEYAKTVPYYIVQIYYAQGENAEVEARAEQLLSSQPDNENSSELHRMLGEIYYQKATDSKDTKSKTQCLQQAVSHFEAYRASAQSSEVPLVRNDLYLLGQSYYMLSADGKTDRLAKAVETLKQVKQEKDSVSESTCLTLGNAYTQLGQTEQAKLSYQAAAAFRLTPSVREEALYNYTLCTYQSSTALGESVQAFKDFLQEYPHSKHQSEVYALLSDAFLRSRNYAAALSVLDSVPQTTRQLNTTKQYLRYQLGVDAFLQGKMDASRNYMTEVLNHAHEDDTYTTEAYYWRAETAYRLHDYESCIKDLNRYHSRTNSRNSVNYTAASYLAGYAYFAEKDYKQAETCFLRYVDMAQTTDPTYPDALNRLGDCAFNARNFTAAISYYGQVIDRNTTGSDYATFQRGYALGLQHKYADKIQAMQTLVARYPKSDYADDGLYETARAYLQQDNERAAITAYEQLLKNYPNSSYARKASLECAMLYRNLNQYNEAIAAYRKTIETYPASEEAYSALEGLQSLYVETGNIDEYLAYTKQLGKMNMQVTTADDSLSYAAAELQYMQGNYQKAADALSSYLTHYCTGGRYCTTAQYYAADSYYRLGQTTDALREYKALAELSGNPYLEEACMRVAGLSYDQKDYQTSLEYFYRMLSLASSHENTDIARLGILRCSYYLGRHQATIDIAAQILADNPTDEVRSEALYNRAKAYIAEKQYTAALEDLAPLSKEVRTATGAESEYLKADCYYRQGNLDQAEAEVMAFAGMNTQQQYWLARALVLLSDINHSRGDDFQARQYLLTLQANYHGTDDIAQMVSERIAALDEKENEQVTENDENE